MPNSSNVAASGVSTSTKPHVELVKTTTTDDVRLDGALYFPSSSTGHNKFDAVLLLHGVGGNFYGSSLLNRFVPPLTEAGLHVLLVNTRGHDGFFNGSGGRRFGAAFEVVDECRLDIAAWINFLAQKELRRVVLAGHSLGAIKAVYYQAQSGSDIVRRVLAMSPPRLSYECFQAGCEGPEFFESYATARRMVKHDGGDDVFKATFPFPLLISARTFIDKYGPGERYNILKFSDRVACPTLFTYGSAELEHGGIAFAGLPEALDRLPGGERRRVIVVEEADHHYSGLQEELIERVLTWLF